MTTNNKNEIKSIANLKEKVVQMQNNNQILSEKYEFQILLCKEKDIDHKNNVD